MSKQSFLKQENQVINYVGNTLKQWKIGYILNLGYEVR